MILNLIYIQNAISISNILQTLKINIGPWSVWDKSLLKKLSPQIQEELNAKLQLHEELLKTQSIQKAHLKNLGLQGSSDEKKELKSNRTPPQCQG